MIVLWILISLAISATVWFAFWALITSISGRSHWQAKVDAGKFPEPQPGGFYRGTAY